MAARLNPYLHFTGNAREAMGFHRSVLGGELDVMTFGNVDGGGDETPTTASCTPFCALRRDSS